MVVFKTDQSGSGRGFRARLGSTTKIVPSTTTLKTTTTNTDLPLATSDSVRENRVSRLHAITTTKPSYKQLFDYLWDDWWAQCSTLHSLPQCSIEFGFSSVKKLMRPSATRFWYISIAKLSCLPRFPNYIFSTDCANAQTWEIWKLWFYMIFLVWSAQYFTWQ